MAERALSKIETEEKVKAAAAAGAVSGYEAAAGDNAGIDDETKRLAK